MAEADRDPPRVHAPHDRSAFSDALRLAVPVAVFLVHFGAIYGFNGLICSARWAAGNEVAVRLLLAGVTVVGVATVWFFRPRAVPAPEADACDPYDPSQRRHFMARAGRRLAWISIAAMLAVTLPVLLARFCGAGN